MCVSPEPDLAPLRAPGLLCVLNPKKPIQILFS
jgi:hypothetical protein